MIVEMRTYTLKPGTTAQFEERFGAALPARAKVSPLAAFWHSEVGPLNQVIHVWPYETMDERTRLRAEATKLQGWPPNVPSLSSRVTGSGISLAVITACTPGSATAALVSIARIIACACGLRSIRPCSIPESLKSAP